MSAASFAAVFVALYAAHEVGDHWVQTNHQACAKGGRSAAGRLACLRHVATLTATKGAALAAAVGVLGLRLSLPAVVVALLVDAGSHYWADRRVTLMGLADWLGRTVSPGKGEFARLGDGGTAPTGTGAYALDQSWHIGWLFIAALIASIGAGGAS